MVVVVVVVKLLEENEHMKVRPAKGKWKEEQGIFFILF